MKALLPFKMEENIKGEEIMNTYVNRIQRLVLAAVCLALCMVLPFLTGQIPEIGNMLCPMHIPVFLCGFVCGPVWAVVCGAAAPLLRFALFGMPPIFPTGAAMCFELAVSGAVSGALYHMLPRRRANVYISLIAAMLCGRAVWGIVRVIFSGITGSAFTWAAFLSGAFTTAIPGMILHIVLIPAVVFALEHALPWLKAGR